MILDKLFQLMAEKQASDIFISAGIPIHIKIQGNTMPVNQQIMDSAMIASLAQTAGDGILEPSLAALLVWRTFTVAGPFALGTIALALWKRTPPPA